MEKMQLVALANWVVCTLIGYSSLCRLNVMDKRVVRSVHVKYTVLLAGSMASGFQPVLFGEWPGRSDLFFSVCVLAAIVSGMRRWRNGPPADTLRHALN